ncbi:hypothetical protein RND71_028311 [Anisodus tanguticus]|uniref:Uncharacterized protein n=1 Tax=Anisodus tanguticus TaxID=243964 RepID=A0AAE1V1G9_9SOLA|nr:hypothetical protein RND71_028311 [Anisodus tanguticus]
MREPRYLLPIVILVSKEAQVPPRHRKRGAGPRLSIQYSLALSAPGFVNDPTRARARTGDKREMHRDAATLMFKHVRRSFSFTGFDNDPSAVAKNKDKKNLTVESETYMHNGIS